MNFAMSEKCFYVFVLNLLLANEGTGRESTILHPLSLFGMFYTCTHGSGSSTQLWGIST